MKNKSMLTPLVILFLQISCLQEALAKPITGYFETKPSNRGERNRMCIKRLPNKRLEIYISTAYCPSLSDQCYSPRIDSIWFQSILNKDNARYTDTSGCVIDVQFKKNGVKVNQSSNCIDSKHPYLESNGLYHLIKHDLEEEDCGP